MSYSKFFFNSCSVWVQKEIDICICGIGVNGSIEPFQGYGDSSNLLYRSLQSVEVPIDRIEACSSCENYPKRESGIAVGDSSYNRNRGLAQLVQ